MARFTSVLIGFLVIVIGVFLIPIVTDECMVSKKNGETIHSRYILNFLWDEEHRNLKIKDKVNQIRLSASSKGRAISADDWLVHYRVRLSIYKALSGYKKSDSLINNESYIYWATYSNLIELTSVNDQARFIKEIDDISPAGDVVKMKKICDEVYDLRKSQER